VDLDALRQIEPFASLPRYQLLRASRLLLWRIYAPGDLILPHQVRLDLKGLVYRGRVQIATVQNGCRQTLDCLLAGHPIDGDSWARDALPVELRAVESTVLCLVPPDGLPVASLFGRTSHPVHRPGDTPRAAVAGPDRTTAMILALSTIVLFLLLAWYWQTPWRVFTSKLTYGLAVHYLEEARPAKALYLLRTSLKLNPRLANAYNDMGYILYEQGRPREALAAFEKAVTADSKSATALNNLGFGYLSSDQVDLAGEALKSAAIRNPESAVTWINLGTAAQKSGRVEEAIHAYRAALRVDPDNLVARVNLGVLFFEREQFSEARTHLKAALDQEPDLPRARVILGAIALSEGDLTRARSQFRSASSELTGDPMLHFYLALWYKEAGQWESARRRLTKVLELHPHPDLVALARSHLEALPFSDQPLFEEEIEDE
jgi:Tfp pilus assembly protein PilF